ncbi:MAG TPA: ParB/RepB/Spo0J family partition protein [bacterium]|nr:ParB/RepB/Spo0J family partition protein [bacterium]
MKTNRLGRGLEALIPQIPPEAEGRRAEDLFQIDVALIRVNPHQPRVVFDPDRMMQLRQSIEEHGVIQPITVRKHDGGYELISGERRLRAVIDLGYERIPAYVIKVESEDGLLELALIENIQREDLNAVEVAHAYQRLQKEYGLTQEEVARKVGKDRATVANFVRILKLPEQVQNAIQRDEISMGHARALMGLESRDEQIRLCRKIILQQLNVRQVEDQVRKLSQADAKKTDQSRKRNPDLEAIEDRFRTALGCQVKIRPSVRGGKIEIVYYSKDDLERLTELIDGVSG